MEDNFDLQEELKNKNYELYINKLIVDLEKTMESLLMFYSNYCDTLSKDSTNIIISYLDNSLEKQDTVSNLVNTFFGMIKGKINTIIKERLENIKNNIQNIDHINYEKKLNDEALLIANQLSDYYQENIYMLIDEISKDITTYRLDFKDYLLNTLYRKLINTLRDKLMYSIKLINNNYDENTMMLETINQKTLK